MPSTTRLKFQRSSSSRGAPCKDSNPLYAQQNYLRAPFQKGRLQPFLWAEAFLQFNELNRRPNLVGIKRYVNESLNEASKFCARFLLEHNEFRNTPDFEALFRCIGLCAERASSFRLRNSKHVIDLHRAVYDFVPVRDDFLARRRIIRCQRQEDSPLQSIELQP